MNNHIKIMAASLAVVAAIGSARADFIYNNSTTDTGYRLMFANNQIIGQEIIMDGTALGAMPYLTNFSFEYYSPNSSFSGAVQAEVKFYQNTGTPVNGYNSPGSTPFYDSGWFSLVAPLSLPGGTTVATIPFNLPELYDGPPSGAVTPLNYSIGMPADFTVVYSFQGLTGGDLIGLPSFNAPNQPTVGTNNGDYWVDSGGGNWSLVTNNAGPVAFGMQFSATPEPSVLGLGAMGLAVMAGLIKRRKK